MKKLLVLVLSLTLLTFFPEASPILKEKEAKQLLRSRRQDRPSKPGFPDEPMRHLHLALLNCDRGGMAFAGTEGAVGISQQEYMHYLLALEHRAEEQFLEHWLNPHCKPHCDRNRVHPV